MPSSTTAKPTSSFVTLPSALAIISGRPVHTPEYEFPSVNEAVLVPENAIVAVPSLLSVAETIYLPASEVV